MYLGMHLLKYITCLTSYSFCPLNLYQNSLQVRATLTPEDKNWIKTHYVLRHNNNGHLNSRIANIFQNGGDKILQVSLLMKGFGDKCDTAAFRLHYV